MLLHCILATALLLTLAISPSYTQHMHTIMSIVFIGTAIVIAHFAAFSFLFTISLRALISASRGSSSLNVQQVRERSRVRHRLSVLIWSNRTFALLGGVITLLVGVVARVRYQAAYLLPLFLCLLAVILIIRLWSLNWRVRPAQARTHAPSLHTGSGGTASGAIAPFGTPATVTRARAHSLAVPSLCLPAPSSSSHSPNIQPANSSHPSIIMTPRTLSHHIPIPLTNDGEFMRGLTSFRILAGSASPTPILPIHSQRHNHNANANHTTQRTATARDVDTQHPNHSHGHTTHMVDEQPADDGANEGGDCKAEDDATQQKGR